MFTGCGTALVTPFRKDQSLDEETLRRLVRRQIENGINFLVPCGTTGESPTLTHAEHLRVVEITLEEAKGKVPVVGGAGGYNTAEVIHLSKELHQLGVDGLLSVTPYYNKPTQEGLYQHFQAIANAVRLPIIVYNIQGRTGVNVETATLKRLAGIDNIVGVKEASGNISQMAQVVHQLPESFDVLSGDDAITIPLIALGGCGVISVASNEIPGEMTKLTQLALAGDFAGARALQRRWLPLMEINFIEANPQPVKAAMAMMGLLEPVWRLPMTPPSEASRIRIEAVLKSCGVLPAGGARMRTEIEKLFDEKPAPFTEEHFALFARFRQALNEGKVRSAEPDASTRTGWRVNTWVKKGILLGLRMGKIVDMSPDPIRLPMFDKATFPVKRLSPADGIRLVPGGSSIRDGCYVGKGVICMPPMYINAGTWVGDGTVIDSHALVGSCAQVGNNCHISAAAQLGGVLEPVGAMPVIIEDEVVVGGNCGVYEGTVVKRRAVLASGTILTRSTPVYDIVRGEVYKGTDEEPLMIPEEAVVVPGSRAISHGHGKDWGVSLYTPVIVKYRDSKTDARVQLEDLLR